MNLSLCRTVRNRLARSAVMALLCVFLTYARLNAFWAPSHYAATISALGNRVFPPHCVGIVADANFAVDWHETNEKKIGEALLLSGATLGIGFQAYVPAHHFDRNKEMGGVTDGSKTAFRLGVLYLDSQRAEIKRQLDAGNTDEALRALGRALHALQDFFAHSNFVDGNLDTAEKADLIHLLMRDVSPPVSFDKIPDDLKMTAFGQIAEGDEYAHDVYAKDNLSHAGHSAAMDAAVQWSAAFAAPYASLLTDTSDGDSGHCQSAWKASGTVAVRVSFDPNDKFGSSGFGVSRYLAAEEPARYAIVFENLETATGPAQEVVVTDQLAPDVVDLDSFSLGPIAFGAALVIPPPGLSHYSSDVDLRPGRNLIARINADLDTATGLVTWRLTSLDPATLLPTEDPLAGFLPPNVTSPEGQGSVLFTVNPKPHLSTGIEIRNKATIVFDTNAPLTTPEWFNTIDSDKPLSHVGDLPSTTTSTDFLVQWAGADLGAGIQDYTVFVSEDGGAFAPFVTNTTDTSATFTGQVGKTYEFYSLARDLVGNTEDPKSTGETTTHIVPPDVTPPVISPLVTGTLGTNGWYVSAVNISWTVTDPDSPISSKSGCDAVAATADTASSTFTCQATSEGGTASQSVTIKIDQTAPTLAFNPPSPAPNANGWNHSDVIFSFIATDNLSGVASTSLPSPLTVVGTGTALSRSVVVTDLAGNTATLTSPLVNIDRTPPSISGTPGPAPNGNGWNRTPVSVTFQCTDALSGLASGSPPAPLLLSIANAGQSATGTCSDLAGNTASATVQPINIDLIAPVLTAPSSQTVLQTSPAGAMVTYPSPAIVEAGSGVAASSCTPASGSVFPVGSTTVNCSAADLADNIGSTSFTVTVNPANAVVDGRMFGVGFLSDRGQHDHFAFRVSQVRNRDFGRFEFWINDPRRCSDDDNDRDGAHDGDGDDEYGREHHRPQSHFEATTITEATFSDDPAFQPGHGRQPAVDTVRFSGAGKWNGRSGYTFEVVATDRGEPGRHRDTISLVIRDSRGTALVSVSGGLDGGNIQSTRVAR